MKRLRMLTIGFITAGLLLVTAHVRGQDEPTDANGVPMKLYPPGYQEATQAALQTKAKTKASAKIVTIRTPVIPQGQPMTPNGGPTPDRKYVAVDLGSWDQMHLVCINNKGQILAQSISGNAYIYSNGSIQGISGLDNGVSFPTSINNNDQVCGYSTDVDPSSNLYAFLYSGGSLTMLGGNQSVAYQINDSGQVIGNDDSHAFLYSGGSVQSLSAFGSAPSFAMGINNSGQITGSYGNPPSGHAFLYSDGSELDLGTLGGSSSQGWKINDAGQVIGDSFTAAGANHAFLYSGSSMQDLGTLGGNYSSAQGINNLGEIVGSSEDSLTELHAFLYSNGMMKDLNDLTIPVPGWPLSAAAGINDSGQIICVGINSSSDRHAFLLNPLPSGALDASGNVVPSQQGFGVLPVKDPTKDGLIVITHGWQPKFVDRFGIAFPSPQVSWVDNMVVAISNRLTGSGITGWQVYGYKWIDGAWCYHPSDALNNASKEGENLGKSIIAQGWTHVHFIAHSAGGNLIQTATDEVKNVLTGSPGTVVHETFLDPYVGNDLAGVATYGRGADWADQYFAKDKLTEINPFDEGLFSIAPYTESPVFHSYNVDVTQLDSHKAMYTVFSSVPVGSQSLQTCSHTETSHGWPIDFYMNTIVGNLSSIYDGGDYDGFGFPLSEEGGNWSGRSDLAPGNGTGIQPSVPTKVLGTPDPVCTVIGTLSPPSYQDLRPDATQASALQSQTGTIQKYTDHIFLGSGSPAWLSMVITPTNPVNFVSFDAQFTSISGAQGVLTVLWDTDIIGTLDERVVSPGPQHYRFIFPNAVANSSHVLGLRLDPFTNIQSTITLTNLVLNQVGPSQQPLLSATTNTVNGLRVWQLDGEAGFNYNVLASSDLSSTNWATIATLANTNGMVLFYDQTQTNYDQRFYRAVAQ